MVQDRLVERAPYGGMGERGTVNLCSCSCSKLILGSLQCHNIDLTSRTTVQVDHSLREGPFHTTPWTLREADRNGP